MFLHVSAFTVAIFRELSLACAAYVLTNTGWSSFTPGIHSSKMLHFPFKTLYFVGVRRLTASSYVVYDYTCSVHTDLWTLFIISIHVCYLGRVAATSKNYYIYPNMWRLMFAIFGFPQNLYPEHVCIPWYGNFFFLDNDMGTNSCLVFV